MQIAAEYLTDPAEATDAHVDVQVTLTNDGTAAVTGDLAPVAPLGYPYWSGTFPVNPVTVEPGETTVVVRVHLTTSSVNAPVVPELTFEPAA